MLLAMANTKDDKRVRGKRVVTSRVDAEVWENLEKLAASSGRTISRIIELACVEVAGLSVDELNRRFIRAAKAK